MLRACIGLVKGRLLSDIYIEVVGYVPVIVAEENAKADDGIVGLGEGDTV